MTKKKMTYTLSEEAVIALRKEAAKRILETGDEVSASAVLEQLILKHCNHETTRSGALRTDRTTRKPQKDSFEAWVNLPKIGSN